MGEHKGYILGNIRVIYRGDIGIYWDNGKETGNYYLRLRLFYFSLLAVMFVHFLVRIPFAGSVFPMIPSYRDVQNNPHMIFHAPARNSRIQLQKLTKHQITMSLSSLHYGPL